MLKQLKIEEGWVTLFLIWALVAMAAFALAATDYVDGLEVLLPIASIGVLAGLLLAKSTFSSRTTHLFAAVYGLATVIFFLGRDLPGDLVWRERILDLANRLVFWIGKALLGGGTSRDSFIFVIHTAVIFWILGYTASWYTFRESRVWRAVLPTGIVLLSTVYYYHGPRPLVIFLLVYALLALLYVAYTHLVTQERTWRSAAVRYERSGVRFGFLRASFLVAVVALIVAWNAPVLSAGAPLGDALNQVDQPWRRFQDNWTRLFSSLRSYGTGTNDPYQDTLVLGGPRSVSNDPIMDIYVSERLPYVYWHAVALDTYVDGAWSVSDRITELHIPDDGVLNTPFMRSRSVITQTVRNLLHNSSTIYGAPMPIGSDQQLLVDFTYDEQGTMQLQGLRSRFVLRAGDRYNVFSMVTTADAASLRTAPTDYPQDILDAYLQVPDGITPETLALAAELTAPFDNAYDKASAVEAWLRENIKYNDQIDAPPQATEPIHYTLFVSQEAYCTYYASAMAIMLRTQGIPARIVNGYAQGEFVEDANAYRVRANNAHTWVEVYFPEYGWIQFEPTAAIPVVDRPETTNDPLAGILGGGVTPPTLDRDALLGEELEDEPAADRPLPEEGQSGTASLADMTTQERLAWIMRVVVGVAGLAVAGVVLFAANRYNQNIEGSVERSYGRLESWARWLGIGFRPVNTPYERADLLSAVVPQGKAPIRNLTQYYVVNTFSSNRNNGQIDPRQEWRTLRPLLLRESVRRRLRRNRNKKE